MTSPPPPPPSAGRLDISTAGRRTRWLFVAGLTGLAVVLMVAAIAADPHNVAWPAFAVLAVLVAVLDWVALRGRTWIEGSTLYQRRIGTQHADLAHATSVQQPRGRSAARRTRRHRLQRLRRTAEPAARNHTHRTAPGTASGRHRAGWCAGARSHGGEPTAAAAGSVRAARRTAARQSPGTVCDRAVWASGRGCGSNRIDRTRLTSRIPSPRTGRRSA
jgi:hypothetical protein